MHGALGVVIVVLAVVAVTAFKVGINQYGRMKRRDGTAGFWTKPSFRLGVAD